MVKKGRISAPRLREAKEKCRGMHDSRARAQKERKVWDFCDFIWETSVREA